MQIHGIAKTKNTRKAFKRLGNFKGIGMILLGTKRMKEYYHTTFNRKLNFHTPYNEKL
tara:strand:- start:505 stop:678 length:174 start_codon:yes stop_codon:yes gene_type:complete